MEKRRTMLQNYIETRGEVSTEELCALFPDKSSMTIRRDLAFLAEKGSIIRTFGGARSIYHPSQPEPFYSIRENENYHTKEKIAMQAVQFIENRSAVYIDSGTTSMSLVNHLPDNDLTILTSAPNIGLKIIATKPACAVYLTGGNLNPVTLSCSGVESDRLLKLLNIDIAFMATSGFMPETGFTIGNAFEYELKRCAINKASRVIMLMDSTKVGRNMPYTFAQPSDIDILITDEGIPEHIENIFKENKVTVLKVQE
jgi:DeoR/GlpR family transcriptional regulator of sugar metabolism